VALALLVAWLTFPGSRDTPGTGLDPSWVIGLNIFARPGIRFGRDVIFTYGPLGYLVRPLDVGQHLLAGNLVRLGLYLVLFGFVALLLRGPRRPGVLLFLAILPLVASLDRELDYEILGLAVLALTLGIVQGPRWLVVVAGALLGGLPLMKFGTGVCAGLTLGWGLFLGRRAGLPWRWVAGSAVSFFATFGVLSLRELDTLGGTTEFLARSAQIASGYNHAMASVGDLDPILKAGVLLGLVVASAAWFRPRSPARTVLLISLAPVLYSLKHSFLRQDPGHVVIVFQVVLWTALAGLLLSRNRRELVCTGAILGVTFILGWSILTPSQLEKRRAAFADVVSGRRARENLGALLRPAAARDESRRRTEASLATDVLSAEWRRTISNSSVMVVPWEIALCLANGLHCMPFPTLQMYSAYTPELDRWSARRIRDGQPEFVLLSLAAIDERNMLWDCPETWRALLQGWEVDRTDFARGMLLLRRRAGPSQWLERPLEERTVATGEWVKAPARTGPLRLSLRAEQRVAGKVLRALLRPLPVILEAVTERGERRVYRLVLGTAPEGLLLDAMPENVGELADLFPCCTVKDRVVAVRLSGPGLKSLRPHMTVAWSELQTDHGLSIRPPLTADQAVPVAGEPMLGLEWANGVFLGAGRRQVLVDRARDAKLTFTGWAVDREARSPARAVLVLVDGGQLAVRAEYGIAREDVARYFGEPGYAQTGFRASIALDRLGRGQHRIQASVVSRDGTARWLSADGVEVDVR